MLDKKKIQPNLTHHISLDMAKRASRVGFGSGQSGRGSKRVIFKRVDRVELGCESS